MEAARVTNRSINGTANSETRTFDSLGRLSTDVNKLGTFTNSYVGVTNRLSKIAYPGNASANYIYFPNAQDKRLQQIKNLNNTNALISQQDYAYDVEGQITTWTKNYSGLNPVQRFDFGYDNADQLLTAPLKNASTNALIKQYTYGYDVASNRTSETVATATTTSVPNNVNEITSQSGGTVRTLTYDLNGSLTNGGKTSSSATNASKVYTCEWDAANRLVAINYTGTTNRSEFSYDGLSRVAKIVEKQGTTVKSTRKIVWCGTEMVEFRDATDAVTGRVYQQGEFIGTTGYTFMRDHLGSVRELIKTDGKTLGVRLDYDPYGRQTTVSGNVSADFGFTGLYRHAASGLNFAVYRAYDPDLGRWLSRDPIGEDGGFNLYGYVNNSPLILVDPLGLTFKSNMLFLYDFITGGGAQKRNYGANDFQTQELRNSPGVAQMRAEAQNSQNQSGFGNYDHARAYRETGFDPTSTAWQVGGFYYTWQKNTDGSIFYQIDNPAGSKSLFAGYWTGVDDNWFGPDGPMRTINQHFSWTEGADVVSCK